VMDDFGCVYASTDQNVTVGFEAISNLDWNIYPNPANNELMVEIESDEVSSIDILDLAGRILISRYLDKKGTNVINLSQIIDGTYIVRVNTNSNSFTKKLIVHK
ncbi:MAG: T9SS type A sorting domain-containing protein, partial [Crocinitomicaceae bacterium]|nr:T9SS type A sorting domain-containing protein [Crocinitomicaceae bacterium]